jgi:cobalt-zinc-cadmium efflux system membrane fusion protein
MRRRTRWPRALLATVVVLAGAGGGWLIVSPSRSAIRQAADSKQGGARPEPEKAAGEEGTVTLTPEKREALGLKVAPVQVRIPQLRLTLTGKIMANQDRTVVVAPRTPGRVVKVSAQLGDTVEAGATLALVDSVEASDALADLAHSEAVLALAEGDYQREKLLVEGKIGARKDFLRAEAALQQARVQRDRTRDKLRLLGLTDAMLAEAQKGSGRRLLTPLVAPFRGTVIERQVSEGQLIDAATVPFRIADLSTVWALLDVPETDISAVRIGQPAVIETGRDGKDTHTGRVVNISDLVEEQTRTVKVRVEIPNRERHFRPGMFITGQIVSPQPGPAVLMVPKDAVVLLDEGPVVFVVMDHMAKARPVEVGPEVGGWVPVRKGLNPGEPVARAGAFALKAQLLKSKLGED